jgi:hypothetical protein
MRRSISLLAVLVFATLASGLVQAVPTFVGSYTVNSGPLWTTNPPVYSAREAAALIFGGSPTDYLISIDPSSDYTTITETGWYDGWGEHNGMIFDQDYKLDTGAPGYAEPGGQGTARSAYVQDGLGDNARNYVWTADDEAGPGDATVPGPAAVLLCTIGAGLVGWLRRTGTV